MKLVCTNKLFLVGGCALAVALAVVGAPARAQGVCPGDFCENPTNSTCSNGFTITLSSFVPATTANSGTASYTYEICSPASGTCDGTVRFGEVCLDHSFCQKKGTQQDLNARCSRTCAIDQFRALSHFNIGIPESGRCFPSNNSITGSCTSGTFGVGDGDCGGSVVKCDNPTLSVGTCRRMTVNIAGEENRLGLGSAFVVTKSGNPNFCSAQGCLAGPACDDDICEVPPPPADQCLTRTRGFWGTHPHLIASDDPRSLNLLPVTVCGASVVSTVANACSTSEALCTSAADRSTNPTYLTLVAQLVAAKLNLKATKRVTDGVGRCDSWQFNETGIRDWIAKCQDFCGATKAEISGSGCIEALNAFNNSLDTGFDVTPYPFDAPGRALVDQCQLARGNKKYVGYGTSICPYP